jgi:hypothetical protein
MIVSHRYSVVGVVAAVAMILLPRIVTAQEAATPDMTDPLAVVSILYRVIGIKPDSSHTSESALKRATAITIVDTTTPFLSTRINGRIGWHVDLGRLELGLKPFQGDSMLPIPRDWEAWIAHDTSGEWIVHVSSHALSYDSAQVRKPTRQHAEKMLALEAETYMGLPKKEPPTSLLEALRQVPHAFKAAVIDAQYLLVRRIGGNVVAAWIISCYGYNAGLVPPAGKVILLYQLRFWRTVVDATTGLGLFSENQPSAE